MAQQILLIGYERFGKILFEKLRSIAEVTVATHDYSEKLAAGHDWVVVATPVATHTAIARDCLEKGINVFCEKPLSENPEEITSLIKLAKEKNQKLYIDDVFLYREEYKKIKSETATISDISFYMTKCGTFNDSLLAAHVYHDLYMLLDLTNFAPITNIKILNIACPLEAKRIDVLEFSLSVGATSVHASYDRTQEIKQKTVTVNKNVVWQANTPTSQDALAQMLEAVLSEKVDFEYNQKLALEATRILARIQKSL